MNGWEAAELVERARRGRPASHRPPIRKEVKNDPVGRVVADPGVADRGSE